MINPSRGHWPPKPCFAARPTGADGNDRAESSGAAVENACFAAANSLLRVSGLYKLEAMAGFCGHHLDKRSGTRLVSLAPSTEKRQFVKGRHE